jgi:hypothetical protein
MSAEERGESEQSGMECTQQDYLVSFLVVSGLVLRGYEREGKGEKRRTADIIRLLWAVFQFLL